MQWFLACRLALYGEATLGKEPRGGLSPSQELQVLARVVCQRPCLLHTCCRLCCHEVLPRAICWKFQVKQRGSYPVKQIYPVVFLIEGDDVKCIGEGVRQSMP